MVDLSLMVQHRCFTKRGAIRIQEIDIERLELQLLPKPIHLQRANPESSLWIELGIRLESIFPNQLLDSLSRRRFLGLHNRRQKEDDKRCPRKFDVLPEHGGSFGSIVPHGHPGHDATRAVQVSSPLAGRRGCLVMAEGQRMPSSEQ